MIDLEIGEEKVIEIDKENLKNSIKNDLIADSLYTVVLNYVGKVDFEVNI